MAVWGFNKLKGMATEVWSPRYDRDGGGEGGRDKLSDDEGDDDGRRARGAPAAGRSPAPAPPGHHTTSVPAPEPSASPEMMVGPDGMFITSEPDPDAVAAHHRKLERQLRDCVARRDEEIVSLKRSVDRLQGELEQTRASQKPLEDAVTQLDKERKNLTKQVSSLTASLAEAQRKQREAEERVAAISQQLGDPARSPSSPTTLVAQQLELEECRRTIGILQQELREIRLQGDRETQALTITNQHLRQEMQRQRSSATSTPADPQATEALKAEIATLKESLGRQHAAMTETDAAWRRRDAAMLAEIEQLRAAAAASAATSQASEALISDLKSQLAQGEIQRDAAEERLRLLLEQMAEKESERAAATEASLRLQRQMDALTTTWSEERSRLLSDLEVAQRAHDVDMANRIASLKEEHSIKIQDLEKALSQATEVASVSQREYQDAQDSVDRLRQRVAEAEQRAKALENRLASTVEEQRQQNAANLRQQQTTTEDAVASAIVEEWRSRAASVEAEAADLRAQVSARTQELIEARAVIEDLRARSLATIAPAAAVESDQRVQRPLASEDDETAAAQQQQLLRDEIDRLRKENNELEQRLNATSQALAEETKALQVLADEATQRHAQEIATLRDELEQEQLRQQQRLSHLDAQAKTDEDEKLQLQLAVSRAAAAAAALTDVQREKDDLSTALDGARRELAELAARAAEKFDAERRRSEQDIGALNRRITELEEANTALRGQVSTAQQRDSLAATELDRLRLLLQTEESEVTKLRQSLEQMNEELRSRPTADDLRRLQEDAHQLRGDKERLMAEITQRDADASRARSDSELAAEQLRQLSTLREALSARESEVAQLQYQVQQYNDRAAATQREAALTTARLEQLQRQIADKDLVNSGLVSRCEAAAAVESRSQEQISALSLTVKTLEEKLAAAHAQVESVARARENDRLRLQHGESSSQTLAATNKELNQELTRSREAINVVQGHLLEALRTLPESTIVVTPAMKIHDLSAALLDESQRVAAKITELLRIQSQWAATYDQAKAVNDSTSGQLRDVWRQLNDAKAELAIKDASIARVGELLDKETARSNDLLIANNATAVELHRLQNVVIPGLERRCEELNVLCQQAEEAASLHRNEQQQLIAALASREAECVELRNSQDNLQRVLEMFQQQKQTDMSDRTSFLQFEIDSLKEQLHAATEALNAKRDEMDKASAQFRKDNASKTLMISTLQQKVGEMRKALEETMSKMSDEHMIDKRVVSHLLVNYVHACTERRSDETDIVRVMSGLLNWDEEMMMKAGLIPGPTNPRPPGGTRAAIAGTFSRLWRVGAGGNTAASAAPQTPLRGGEQQGGSSGNASAPSLAQLWVEFLIREGEKAKSGSSGEDNAAASGTAPGS